MRARDRRALLLGGAVILGALLPLKVVPSMVRCHAVLRGRTVERVAMLDRARAAARSLRVVEDSLSIAATWIVGLAPALVPGETAAEAEANLTAEVSNTAAAAGLQVAALNAVPDSTAGTFAPVVLRGQLEGDIRGVAAFLKAVEGGRMLVTVRSLHILANDPLQQQPGEQLRLEMVIAGWRLSRTRS